ncbi:MAG: hypothetical protein ACTHL3_03455 [Candidatus Nitrosocosmicus sp.]
MLISTKSKDEYQKHKDSSYNDGQHIHQSQIKKSWHIRSRNEMEDLNFISK